MQALRDLREIRSVSQSRSGSQDVLGPSDLDPAAGDKGLQARTRPAGGRCVKKVRRQRDVGICGIAEDGFQVLVREAPYARQFLAYRLHGLSRESVSSPQLDEQHMKSGNVPPPLPRNALATNRAQNWHDEVSSNHGTGHPGIDEGGRSQMVADGLRRAAPDVFHSDAGQQGGERQTAHLRPMRETCRNGAVRARARDRPEPRGRRPRRYASGTGCLASVARSFATMHTCHGSMSVAPASCRDTRGTSGHEVRCESSCPSYPEGHTAMPHAPTTVAQVVIVLILVLPGVTYQFVRERARGLAPGHRDLGERVLRAVTAGIVLDTVYVLLAGPWLVHLVYDRRNGWLSGCGRESACRGPDSGNLADSRSGCRRLAHVLAALARQRVDL